MNIWGTIPWDKGGWLVSIDFFCHAMFQCRVRVWRRELVQIDNVVSCFMITPNRMEGLDKVKVPECLRDGELYV